MAQSGNHLMHQSQKPPHGNLPAAIDWDQSMDRWLIREAGYLHTILDTWLAVAPSTIIQVDRLTGIGWSIQSTSACCIECSPATLYWVGIQKIPALVSQPLAWTWPNGHSWETFQAAEKLSWKTRALFVHYLDWTWLALGYPSHLYFNPWRFP